MKKKQIILIVLLIFILIYIYEKIKFIPVIEFNENLNFEYASNIHLNDVINNSNVSIINKQIDTFSLGNHIMKISYYNKQNKEKIYKYRLEYNIVDTTAPVILSSSSLTTTVGNDIDMVSGQICADNADSNIECKVDGQYDINRVGVYPLRFIAIDQSNNKTIKDFTLSVVEKGTQDEKQNKESNKPKEKIKYDNIANIINKYKKNDNEIGIDISRWQGDNIDFKKVKDSGVTFAIIRIGLQDGYNGEYLLDKSYNQNINKAKEAGLKVGLYFYSYANSINEAKRQADWVINNIGNYQLDLPISFDWEDWSNFNLINMNLYQFNEMANSFIDEIELSGHMGMIYGSKYYLENIWKPNNNKVWLAHYASSTTYKGNYLLWQLSNKGMVDGIDVAVDLDILYNN